MNVWSPDQSTLVRPIGFEPSSIPDHWSRWIAENVLRNTEPRAIVDAMVREGFDRETAATEVRAARNHPYIEAARVLLGGAGTLEAKVKKRDWVLECYRRAACQATTFGQISRVRNPSRREFLDSYYSQNRPVVIEGALDDWPALTLWTKDYFKQNLGSRVVEVQANRSTDANYEINSANLKKEMTFGAYVDLIESAAPTNDYYITANNSGKNQTSLKELWKDIGLLSEYLEDKGPNERGFFWYGPKGVVTPLHHDLTNNFMAQVRGRKLVRLMAPYEIAFIYNHRHCYSQVNLNQIDVHEYPEFRNVKVIDVVIDRGDLLFLPVGWWHHVTGLDVTITMTFTNFVFDNDFYSFYTTYEDI